MPLAILFALVTDVLVSARLARVLGGLPRRLRDHVIVCGVGNIGYRVVEHLVGLGVPVVAAELQQTNRFLPAMRRLGVPVTIADIRLNETLQALQAGQARSLVVVTSSDVVNLETALNASELNPDLRVVLRLFDPDLAARVERAFGNHISRSPAALAAPAFAAAAEGERVLATVSVGIPVLLVARVQVQAGGKAEGRRVADLESATHSRTLLLTGAGQPNWCPPGHVVLRAGQELVMVVPQSGLPQILASTQVDLAEEARSPDRGTRRVSHGLARKEPDMWEAVIFGILASSALVIGGALGSYWQAPTRVTGVMLAFASGTLISALAFELFPEAVHLGGLAPAGWGLLAGAATFVVINAWLDSRVAPPEAVEDQAVSAGRPDMESPADAEAAAAARGEVAELPRELAGAAADQRQKVAVASQGVGLALLAAVTLDGVPENLALGVSLAGEEATGGGSLALLVAIFASNFPEALVGAVAMRSQGRSAGYAVGLWAATAVLLTLAVVVGRQALAAAQPSNLAFPLAFAGGAVLASLADTLMPEAFERGRPLNAFATAAGFFVSFILADL